MWGAYRRLLKSAPLATKASTSCCMMMFADFLCQGMEIRSAQRTIAGHQETSAVPLNLQVNVCIFILNILKIV